MYALIYQDVTLQWETTFDTLQEALEYAGMEIEAEQMDKTLLSESLYDRLNGGEKCIRIAWSSNRKAELFLETWEKSK